MGMARGRRALPVVRKRRSGVARRLLVSTSHPRGTDAFVGHLNRSGSSAPATNRGDDLCCLRVFRCPMASLRTDRGEIVLITPGESWGEWTHRLNSACQASGIVALPQNLGLASALRRLECVTRTCYVCRNVARLFIGPFMGSSSVGPFEFLGESVVTSLDSFKSRKTLKVGGKSYDYFSLKAAEKAGLGDLSRLPNSLKVLLENLLRYEDGRSVIKADIQAIAKWLKTRNSDREIAYRPARVLMQDFTGVPAVVDLAAMREAMIALGGDPEKINPLSPVDLVIDHSVMVDYFGGPGAFKKNVELEYQRNGERYAFLRWGQTAFANFRVVPPGTGICHQVNLENLAQVVWTAKEPAKKVKGRKVAAKTVAYPDTLVGTDSHTTMVNGLAVLGWGVGGIEAEAAMLGQPISMLIPEVIGLKLTGKLKEGVTATDLVLTVTQMLRKKGVVGKFVEFYGPGLTDMAVAHRAAIGNLAPAYGASCGFSPVDQQTVHFPIITARTPERVALVEAYAKAQGMWRTADMPDPVFTDTLGLDLSDVQPSLAGPKRPQDRVTLDNAKSEFTSAMDKEFRKPGALGNRVRVEDSNFDLGHGDVVIAAITSCTNTSNPSVMIGAGLLARNAVAKGLKTKPWVKTSLAPGSKVVTEYLERAGLTEPLEALGFHLVGYGCTTCIGNSGPLPEEISEIVSAEDLAVVSVLSGNRNFEGRINPDVKMNYLASPPLCVVYALAGTMDIDLLDDPLGLDEEGKEVFLSDIWP